MRTPISADKSILLELEGVTPPSQCSIEQLTEWLLNGSTEERVIKIRKRTAYVIARRFCHVDTPLRQPAYTEIGRTLNIGGHRAHDIAARGLELLRMPPRYNTVLKSGILIPGTRLYLEIFGDDQEPMYW